ncbi:MAG: thioesterase [Thermoleophilia bacterium]|nr:thioesterase [Thermoleophilia bacterium]
MHDATPLTADPRPGTRPLADTALAVLGIELLHCARDRVEARMPVDGSIACRGLLLVVAETVASTAAGLAAGDGRRAFGAELNASFVAQPAAGSCIANATPYELGHERHVWRIQVHDSAHELVLESRCTLSVVDAPA